MKWTIAVALIVAIAPASAFGSVTRARYLMGTICEITADDEREIDSAFGEAARIESMLSTWRNDTDLARVNSGRPTQVSSELMQLIYDVLKYRDYTNGAFNPLVGPLIDIWQTRGQGAVPSEEEIAEALKRVTTPNPVIYPHDVIALQNGARFDEGAFGKGYALDRMLWKIKGDVVINFGGQLAVHGRAPVSIADPEHRDTPVVAFAIDGGSLSTSSASEQTFEVCGVRFSHIIDPRNGRALPPRGSVTVIGSSAFLADIYSTALYVMGVDEGLRWANDTGVAALFITADHTIRMSSHVRQRAKELKVLDEHFAKKER